MAEILERDMDPEELEAEDDMLYSSSGASSTQSSTLTWINWFTSLPGHDYFCEVHEEFIEDDFNLTGLQAMIPFWKEALEMVLDVEPEEDSSKIPDVSIVEASAELLYGLVHQRFILTKAGLSSMCDKYEAGHFGSCPRVYCHWTHVLPCGRSDIPGIDTVKLYCPNCGDIYAPPSSKYASVDGAFFGTTFAPMFFQTYPELLSAPFGRKTLTNPDGSTEVPSASPSSSPDMTSETQINPDANGGQRPALCEIYTPRIYGFKVSQRARSGPRMRWLRDRPQKYEELDLIDGKGKLKQPNSLDGQVGAGGEGEGMDIDSGKKTGTLFDDEDEELEEEDDEEEEEEEGAAAAAGETAVQPTSAGSGTGQPTGRSQATGAVKSPRR